MYPINCVSTYTTCTLIPQPHPTTGPVRFLSPVQFLARNKAEWSARRNFTSALFSWSHQATGPVRLDTEPCILLVWLNNSHDPTGTPCDARTGIVRPPHGNLQSFSYPTGFVRGPCVTRKGAMRPPSGHVRELTQKSHTGVVFGRTDPLRSPHGLFTGW